MDGQAWFDFAWSAQLLGRDPADAGDAVEPQEKIFSKSAGRGLNKVISIAPDGTETAHWQVKDVAVAWTLARRLADRLTGERVKIRERRQIVTMIETEHLVERRGDAETG